jgi:cytochrome P450
LKRCTPPLTILSQSNHTKKMIFKTIPLNNVVSLYICCRCTKSVPVAAIPPRKPVTEPLMTSNMTMLLTALKSFIPSFLDDEIYRSIVLAFALLLLSIFFTRSSRKNGLPYVHGLPLIGSLAQVFGDPVRFVVQSEKRYGNKFYCDIAGSTWLFVLHPNDVKYVSSLPSKSASLVLAYKNLFGFIFPKDSFKEAIGHIIAAVKPTIIREWLPTVRKVIHDMINDLPAGQGQLLDLFEFAKVTISAVTTMLMIGEDVFADKSFLKEWTQLFLDAGIEEAFASPRTAVNTLIGTTLFGERRVYRDVRALLSPLVDKAIDECIAGKDFGKQPSVLQSMVKYQYDKGWDVTDSIKRKELNMTIANDLFNFSNAAFGNSFAGAGWTLYHILKNTNGLGTKIRQEIAENPEQWGLSLSPTIQNAVLEVTRLYTPGSVPRLIKNQITLPSDGTVVQAGTTIGISHFYIARQGFTSPLTFDPSRFDREEDKKVGLLMGFGLGSHPCVGKSFAIQEISLFVQECIQSSFQLAPREEVRHAEFMDTVIDDVNHPNLTRSQSGFLWRPENPVYLLYSK